MLKKSQKPVNTLLLSKWKQRTHDTHMEHLKEYSGKSFKVAFLGDSMMERWKTTDNLWQKHFPDYANLGVGGDMINNLLYRISGTDEGKGVESILDTIKVDKIILMIGTNNSEKSSVTHICEGIMKVISIIFEKLPNVELIVYGLPYRKDVDDTKMDEINAAIEEYIKNQNVPKLTYRLLNIGKEYLMDNVHFGTKGYSKWLDDLKLFL